MKHTVKITVETKKGTKQETRWSIVQEKPYPSLSIECGRAVWRNGGGIFGQYGSPAAGIGSKYYCNLLKADYSDATSEDNRKDYAGFNGNAGTITLRGRDLGETQVKLDIYPNTCNAGKEYYADIKVNSNDNPSTAERAFIEAQIVPELRAYITAHAAELKADAVNAIRQRVAAEIDETRRELVELEAEAMAAVSKL